MAPEMAGVVPQIAEPAATRPGLTFHGHGSAIGPFVVGPHLLQNGLEDDVDGRGNLLIHYHFERLNCFFGNACRHISSPCLFWSVDFPARSGPPSCARRAA